MQSNHMKRVTPVSTKDWLPELTEYKDGYVQYSRRVLVQDKFKNTLIAALRKYSTSANPEFISDEGWVVHEAVLWMDIPDFNAE